MSVAPANRRRDIRRVLPTLHIGIGELEYQTRDWSLGGFALVETAMTRLPFEIKDQVEGAITIENRDGSFVFRAILVRLDEAAGVAGFRFVNMDPTTFTTLERLMLRAEPAARSSDGRQAPRGDWFTRRSRS